MSNSLWPHGLQYASFPYPSLSPGVCSNTHPLSQWCHPASHPLSPPSPLALNLSQHQGLFQPVSSLHQVAKYLNPFFHPRNKTVFLPILKKIQSCLHSDPLWSARVDTSVCISIPDKLGSLLTQIIKTIERKVVVFNKMLKKKFLTLGESELIHKISQKGWTSLEKESPFLTKLHTWRDGPCWHMPTHTLGWRHHHLAERPVFVLFPSLHPSPQGVSLPSGKTHFLPMPWRL